MRLFLMLIISTYLFAKINLDKNEQKFIKTHTVKCITTPNWAPFNTYINGKISGISIDYWNLIKKKLNLKTKCIIVKEWPTVLEKIKNKKADLTISTSETKQRKKYAIFTKPYAVFPIAIATRNNVGFIASMKLLKNKKIVVGKNYTAAKMVEKNFPDYNIVEVKNIKTALKMVSEGKAYAAIDIMPVLIYNINKFEFANLKISGKTPLEFKMQFMIRNDYPLLKNAINKAIDTITIKEKEKIYGKWIYVKYQNGYTAKQIIKGGIVIAVIFVIIFIYWIIRLKKEINKRSELEEELKKFSIYDALTSIYNRYKMELVLKSQIEFCKKYHVPMSLVTFKINNFKEILTKYETKDVNQILINIANILKTNLRENDSFGRWDESEFLIILPNTHTEEAKEIILKIKKLISTQLHHINFNCSFAVTKLKNEDTAQSIISRIQTYIKLSQEKNDIITDINFR